MYLLVVIQYIEFNRYPIISKLKCKRDSKKKRRGKKDLENRYREIIMYTRASI